MSSPLKQALLSRSFARDVSSFAFLFAGLNAVLGLVALFLASSLEVRLDAAGVLAAGLFFAALGWFTRRGSRIALFVTLGMFALDVVAVFVMPPARGLAGALFTRVVILGFLVRNLNRLRARASRGDL